MFLFRRERERERAKIKAEEYVKVKIHERSKRLYWGRGETSVVLL
jgi:hypothetical protein